MIPFESDITAEDRLRADQLVEFYLGSYDNITEDNAQALIDLFSDSGNLTVKFQFPSEFYILIRRCEAAMQPKYLSFGN